MGFDSHDRALDIVVAPDLSSWEWKDEDELAWAVAAGRVTAAEAAETRAEGERAVARITRREPPLDEDWTAWRSEIRFHPESVEPTLVAAAGEYQRSWGSQGRRIVKQLAAATGLRFAERFIEALVFEGVSGSQPLRLRATYDEQTKLGTLIHELAHRLIADNRARLNSLPRSSREEHELIDLFLFDLWTDLYGEAFAQGQVEVESRRRELYRKAWDATLAMDRDGRAARLRTVLGQGTNDAAARR